MKNLKPGDPSFRAAPFKATRRQHFEEAAEDYTELVADLIEKNGEARTCTIAEHLGISHVTAIRTIKRLQSSGYLATSPHRPVELTTKGRKLAAYCKHRHQVLLSFFARIGIPEDVAQIDVEGVEHHISKTSLAAIEAFLLRN